ncbi:hypothetical protein F5Y15DRAFT_419578 [Xylariaceae sp. FL0016]|nr:hypothetical protein F5Y15DRAFT_419578 [Xylariaceae sp. FL0016]
MPRKGMIYRNPYHIMTTEQRDRSALHHFKAADPGKFTAADVERSRSHMKTSLTDMFHAAETLVPQFTGSLETDGFFLFIGNLQKQITWAKDWDQALFVELFITLVNARQKYHDDPRYPFQTNDPDSVTLAIDQFRETAGSHWEDACCTCDTFKELGGFDQGVGMNVDSLESALDEHVVEDELVSALASI